MQDIELYRQLKLIHTNKLNYSKYLLLPEKPNVIDDVERYIAHRRIKLGQISQLMPFLLPKIAHGQEDDGANRSALDLNRKYSNLKSTRKSHIDIHILPDIKINIVKRSMIDDKSGKSKFFLTALKLENNITPYQKFKSIAKSVGIFLSFFRWIAKNAHIILQWSWTYDPATYLYKNPFKNNGNSAIDFALSQSSSHVLECYSGWLREDIRSLLRIHPSQRKDRDIDILMKYFSTMKSFKKYNAQSRREFLSKGQYNSWEEGRHVIKEGYPALAVYFILDGEVGISKMKSVAVNNQGKDNSVVAGKKYKRWDGNNMIRLSTLFSGDSFGEVAFTLTSDHTRSATVTTVRKSEFLLVEIHDATHIIERNNDNSFARKIEFISSIPLLQSLRVDARTLAYYCAFKSVTVNVPLLIEGENSPNMYFIRSGDCRLLKTVKIIKARTGNLILKTLDGSLVTQESRSEARGLSPFVQYQLVVVGQLKEGDHFGEGFLDNSLTWLNGAIGHCNSRFSGKITKGNLTTVVTNSRTEIMSIPKTEIHRFATEETWKHFLLKSKEIPTRMLYQSYEKVLKWAEMKSEVCKHLTPHYRTDNSEYI